MALDTSTITACANDYSFEELFSRNFEALHQKGDILMCISTSGNSKNILNVLKVAKKEKFFQSLFLEMKVERQKIFSDLNIIVKSSDVARIQECHIFLGHYILENVENLLIKR